jgi:hypothetical protein
VYEKLKKFTTRSLQGKKSPFSRFLKILCAKRNKLPGRKYKKTALHFIPPDDDAGDKTVGGGFVRVHPGDCRFYPQSGG